MMKSDAIRELKSEIARLEIGVEYYLTFEQKLERLRARKAYLEGELTMFQETH